MAFTYPIHFAAQMREHLRALRKKRGLTQAQLGAQLGVSQARIAEIEANPGLVSFEQVLQLLSHLGSGLLLEEREQNAVQVPRAEAHEAGFENAGTQDHDEDDEIAYDELRRLDLEMDDDDEVSVYADHLRELEELDEFMHEHADTTEPEAIHARHVFRKKKGSW